MATGSGALLQQIPPAPAPTRAVPDIRVDRPERTTATPEDKTKFPVTQLRVSGQTAFTNVELLAASGFVPGQFGLNDLRVLAAKITTFYNRHGYVVAQAYLPAQDIKDGTVTIAVIEGRYEKVAIRNTSRLSDHTAHGVVAGLDAGNVVTIAPLERRLLLLSDLPGTRVGSTLSPGSAVGTTDLQIDIAPAPLISGSIDADNGGNRYTGYYRAGGTVNLNEPLGIGDVLSVRGLVSDRGLTYIRGSYQATLRNLTLGVAYARLDYRLHREFSALDAHGSAGIATAYASYPLIRSYDSNLYVLMAVDAKRFRDIVGVTSSATTKHSLVATPGLSGDHHDTLLGGGTLYYSAYWSFGDLDIRTPQVRAIDALTARSNGHFNKLSLFVARNQAVVGALSLYASARGQFASKNLDISEKMELGGAYGVRAYPEGEAYGDQGYVATVEARLLLPPLGALPGRFQLVGFVDNGHVRFDRDRYALRDNAETLTGAGAGVTWLADGNFVVKASYAHRVGSTRVTSEPDKSGRFWVQLSKSF